MRETLSRTTEMGMSGTPELGPESEEELSSSRERVEEFLDEEAEILGAYGMKGDIVLERGSNGWAFDFENRRLIYDPSFFRERGYNLKETLFATTHELMAHYGELMRDPETILREAKRYNRQGHLHLLHNIFEDVLGNRRIVAELPFLEETRRTLYKEKMFPPTDYRDKALHVQFAYGFIRQAMVPDEPIELSPEARSALEKLRAFGNERMDILDLVTTPSIEPKDRFAIMRQIVEPVYLGLYREDIENEKKKGSKGGEPRPGDGHATDTQPPGSQGETGKSQEKKRWWPWKKSQDQGEGKKSESRAGKDSDKESVSRKEIERRFKEQYKEYEESHPEPLAAKDEEKLKRTFENIVADRGGAPSLDRKLREQWAREHGVDAEDVLGYRKEYQEVAPLIAELREVFKKIVSRRLKDRLRLAPQLTKEGEEIEESTLAEAYAESRAGGEPHAFRETTRTKRESEGYGALDMTLVNDLSGSMGDGLKLPMDRQSKLLFLESLADFQQEIADAEFESGLSLGLNVRTETRAFGEFGDAELKKLSPDLSEQDRIGIWKKLQSVNPNAGTPDYLSLEAVLQSMSPEHVEELQKKTRRKVVVVLTDGESHDRDRAKKALLELRRKGVIALGLGMTQSGTAVLDTYAPDAEVIADIKKLPEALQNVILKYTQDL
jgi:hypothetical protein